MDGDSLKVIFPLRVSENPGDQHDGGRLALDDDLIIPLENRTQSRSQQVLPLQLTGVNSLEVLANGVLGISAISKSFGKMKHAANIYMSYPGVFSMAWY